MNMGGEVETSVSEGWQWSNLVPVITTLVILVGASRTYNIIVKTNRRWRWCEAGRDVVVLHCPGRGRFAPSMSPFVLKLETFLRFANITYKLDFEEPFGVKDKTPWVTFNGEELTDSQLVIERFTQHFHLKNTLTKEQRAVAKAFTTMMDEHLIWGLRVWRYDIDRGAGFRECFHHLPFYMSLGIPVICWKMRRALWEQGIGRHSFKQVQDFVRQDLTAVSDFLGDKSYLMGEEVSTADCVVFAHLANIVYNYRRSPFHIMVTEELVNLREYVERVRNTVWPDWQRCLDPPQNQHLDIPDSMRFGNILL
ncbi:failed axon connections homolog isoform X2 [Homarus americanus]|uniref:Failed axon connections-like 3 n=1 Tax=Homarus americanus TaxID=6706 RepID=A0A8J5MJG5_HOMAM|nr:failed axon connections homolog isoform X2 [Homarus americanus]KAG7153743.1 Failed axon connections-like 3 [Homarus americanus]